MGKTIMFASGKGGSGTTTFTVNLGVILANTGAKVLVFDMNIGLRNDDIYLGMEDRILFDLGDVASGLCPLEKAVIAHDCCPNLYLLPCSQCKGISGFSGRHIQTLLEKLREDYDYVLVDCPVSIGKVMEYIAGRSDKAVLVVTPDYVSVRNTDAVSKRLESIGMTDRCFAINKVTESVIGGELSLDWISETMEIPLVGMLSLDETIHQCNNRGVPAALDGSSYYVKTFIEIAARIIA